MDSNNKNNSYLYFISYIVIGIFIISFFFGQFGSSQTSQVDFDDSLPNKYDEIYTREYEDKLIYTADIISCKDEEFVIRKIVNSSGYGDYQVIVKLNSGNYEVTNLNENSTNLYILGTDKKPYVEFEFNSGSLSLKKSNLYLPSNYTIEILSKTDSIVNTSNIDITKES